MQQAVLEAAGITAADLEAVQQAFASHCSIQHLVSDLQSPEVASPAKPAGVAAPFATARTTSSGRRRSSSSRHPVIAVACDAGTPSLQQAGNIAMLDQLGYVLHSVSVA